MNSAANLLRSIEHLRYHHPIYRKCPGIRGKPKLSNTPRRIIVVDPSLRDNVGHYIEYDLSLIHGALYQGLEVVVLAHKEAATLLPKNESIIPTFSEDIWRKLRSAVDADIYWKLYLHKLSVVPVIHRLFAKLAIRFRRISTAIRPAVRSLKRRSRLTGRVLRWFIPPIIDFGARMLLAATLNCGKRICGLRWLAWLILPNPKFYFELKKALRQLEFDDRDLIFCHTATHKHLLEWGLCVASLSSTSFARVVLLLRFPLRFYAPSRLHSKVAFRLLEQGFEAGKLRMATDSERLANEYADLTFAPFEVLPIPHTGVHERAMRKDMPQRQKICVASLGNARAEKGIVEILDAVRLLQDTYDRELDIEFFLQLNDPDKHCSAHVRCFLDRQPKGIRYTQTALSSEEYQRLLTSVDVVLLPYWGEAYASRTSGIFLEAIAAGKPVVVTENTWMADELAAHGAGIAIPSHSPRALADAIVEIHDNFERYSTRAIKSAQAYVLRHSPRAVLQQLATAIPSFSRPLRRALICYPWEGLLKRTSGAAIRTGHLIEILKENRWEAALLLHGSSRPEQCDAMDAYEYGDEVLNPFKNPELALFAILKRIGTFGRSQHAETFLFMHYYWLRSRRFKLLLNKLLARCGVAFVEYTFIASIVKPLVRARHMPLIVTSHDVLAMQVSDLTIREELFRLEARALGLADLAVTVSSQDQATFRASGVDTIVIPNSIGAIDLERLTVDEAKLLLDKLGLRSGCPFVVFFGSAFIPNYQARDILKRIAPELARRVPGTLVVVAGNCARPKDSFDNFRCLGEVNDDVKLALYKLCGAVVIPLQAGSGNSLKTIEAMAHGCPVVGTSVAFRGLDIEDRVNAVIQNDISLLVDGIAEVLQHRVWAAKLGEAARIFAMGFDFRKTYRPYIEFLESWTTGENIAN